MAVMDSLARAAAKRSCAYVTRITKRITAPAARLAERCSPTGDCHVCSARTGHARLKNWIRLCFAEPAEMYVLLRFSSRADLFVTFSPRDRLTSKTGVLHSPSESVYPGSSVAESSTRG